MITMVREFASDFIKIRRTPMLLLHVLSPMIITALFLAYCGMPGQRMVSDVRAFFILLQMGYPLFAGIATAVFLQPERNAGALQNMLGVTASRKAVYFGKLLFLLFFAGIAAAVFLQPERNAGGLQNMLGVTASRKAVYLGKLLFLLFFAGINVLLYEISFCVGGFVCFGEAGMDFEDFAAVFVIFLGSNLFLYVLHMGIVLRFGEGISVFAGICGTVFAGIFENPIGDSVWPFVPWEWGIRFLKHDFGFSEETVFRGGGICGTVFAGIFENPIGDSVWPFVPWEWGIRFLKHDFGFSEETVFRGGACAGAVTAVLLLVSLVRFDRWEGEHGAETE